MPFNVLLLPLLGGYLFLSHWNYTRFDARQYSGHRLLFHAAAWGSFFIIIAFSITSLSLYMFPELEGQWQKMVPFEYSGTSVLAFFIGATLWWPLNRIYFRKDDQARRAITEWNDFLEILLERAQREFKSVAIVLKTRKVYIGLITGSFDPINDRKYIQLLPLKSGYRDPDTLQLHLTTDYSRVFQKIVDREVDLPEETINDFEVVIPVSEITSVNFFDPDLYDLFNQNEPPTSTDNRSTD